MSGFVFIESAPSQGTEHAVDAGTTIGREGCDITLSDSDVSRRHAQLQISNGRLSIEDLGSTNGTFVNRERISGPRTLSDGDEVQMGSTVWRLRAPADATRLRDTPDVAEMSQATRLRPSAAPEPPAERAAPEPPAERAAPAPAAERALAAPPTEEARPSTPPAQSRRGDVPLPDFAPSAIRRVVPAEAPTAFTPESQGGRGGSAATRGGATLFSTLVIALTTAGVVLYYIIEPFK